MSLRQRIEGKAGTQVPKAPLVLVDLKETVMVRGLMFGVSRELGKAGDSKRAEMMVATCVEDPDSGELVWDVTSKADLEFIKEKMTLRDVLAITEKCEVLSGVREPEKAVSSGAAEPDSMTTQTLNSPTSSSPRESEDEPLNA